MRPVVRLGQILRAQHGEADRAQLVNSLESTSCGSISYIYLTAALKQLES